MEVTREIVLEAPIDEVWDGADRSRTGSRSGSRTTSSSTSSPAVTASSAGTTARNGARSWRRSSAGRRLALGWGDDGRVQIDLAEVDGGTRVVVTETAGSGWATALSLRAFAPAFA